MTDVADRRRRSGGRAGNAARRGYEVIEQMPWRLPVNSDRPTEPLTEEGVAAIHDGAMRILEEIGIEFLNPEALEILRKAGCTVDGENVRMGRDFVMEMVAKAPSQFTLTPRNPDRTDHHRRQAYLLFGNVSSPPNYWDMEIGRKVPGTREMCREPAEADAVFQLHPFRRRLSGGAGRYPCLGPPSRCAL